MYTPGAINSLYFELIKVSLGSRGALSHTLSNEEWNAIFKIAEKHSLLGICFGGVQKLHEQGQNLDIDLLMEWLGQAEYIKTRNEEVNKQCVEVINQLKGSNFNCCILKGQGVGFLYGKDLSLLRQSGDIDVWVDGGMPKAMAYVQNRYGNVAYDYINAHIPMLDDTEVELHWRCSSMTDLPMNKKLQKWLKENDKELIGNTIILATGEKINVPSAKFNLFYILLHIFNHMFGEGVGLRQLMDYYFVLKNADVDEATRAEVSDAIKCFGMNKFASAIMWIMQYVFELDNKYFLCNPNEKEGRFILDEVMRGGNFGHFDDRNISVSNRKLHSLVNSTLHNWHLFTHYPSKVFWAPIWLAYHYVWKRTAGRV